MQRVKYFKFTFFFIFCKEIQRKCEFYKHDYLKQLIIFIQLLSHVLEKIYGFFWFQIGTLIWDKEFGLNGNSKEGEHLYEPLPSGVSFSGAVIDKSKCLEAVQCMSGSLTQLRETLQQVEVVRQQVQAGRRVLVCAASNAAVDNMVHALLTSDRTLPLARAGLTGTVDFPSEIRF